ncbi:hypothetical protein GCM10025865_27520 [Paraoerskovia sediminicola]|uniref:Glycerate kinase n=1 Tax=Paraoerskovia sediminicola TaxID=1138587 RepID=A0ABM8G5T3_9CELL|nr:hypothetical protein GCM10025865_27520 [Paraoerskovia sediminicola]
MSSHRSDAHPARVVVAVDKFKGSASAVEVGAALRRGLLAGAADSHRDLVVDEVPVADGGEGTCDAALRAGFTARAVTVAGPTGEPVEATLAVRGTEAVVEMAAASGLALLPGGELRALDATSRGTGDLIRAALDLGCDHVVLAVGGSACTDGGAGMLVALGARLVSDDGAPVPPGGGGLASLAGVELDDLDPRVARTRFTLASDVDNPCSGSAAPRRCSGPRRARRRTTWLASTPAWTGSWTRSGPPASRARAARPRRPARVPPAGWASVRSPSSARSGSPGWTWSVTSPASPRRSSAPTSW